MHYLLFLDVDGVLNSMSFYHSVESITENPVDPEAVKRVAKLIKLTEQLKPSGNSTGQARGGVPRNTVNVILTSSWRVGWNKDPKLQDTAGRMLDNTCAMYGVRLYDKTGVSQIGDRPVEVLEYLRKYPYRVNGFVILDDANFFWEKYRLSEWWVQTSFKQDGFQESMIEPALSMLANPPWWLKLFNIGKKKHT